MVSWERRQGPGCEVCLSLGVPQRGSGKGVPVVSCAQADSQVEGPSPSTPECAPIWK